jgi:diaminohydroxyphosphoribosylaminopyrimidine deaminase/5-amino-6-(5-phosphoribosylamino)uracil reductase
MPTADSDLQRLREALVLAQGAIGVTEPNPRVGCLLADAQGRIVGRGATQQAGGPHAEVMALRQAAESGAPLAGGTAWVTLEPCAHHGRTPPCCDALVAAGLARVVIGTGDPFPPVAGAGIERLRAAGLAVELADGEIARACRELNIGFFSRVQRGRPWLRMKVAASLDGRTALNNGRSQWITGVDARTDGHAWRRRASAVLTGIGTVRDDDPRLDVRLVPTARQPLRVVVDSRLDMPPTARILGTPGAVLVYAAAPAVDRVAALQARGAEVACLPGSLGKVDLAAMLQDLARRGVNELHVEAGSKLNGSFVREGLVDEWLVYVAPKLIGSGRALASFGPLASLGEAVSLRFHAVDRFGDDLRLLLRPNGELPF